MTRSCTLYIFLSLILTQLSCSKNQALFEVETFIDMTVIAGSNTLNTYGFEQEVLFPMSGSLNAFGITEDDIEIINSRDGVVFQVFGDGLDLDFIDVIVVRAVDPDDDTNSLEVFYHDPVQLGSKQEINLFPSLPDIKDFIRNDRIILRIELNYRFFPPRNVDLRADLKFGVIKTE